MNGELAKVAKTLVVVPQNPGPEMRERLRRGELVQLASRRAIEREDFRAMEHHQRRIARIMAIGQSLNSAIVLGSSAALLHGMWSIHSDVQAPVRLALPSGSHPPRDRWPQGSQYVKRALDPEWVCSVMDVSVTDPLETWLEIARELGFCHALIAADWLLKHGFARSDLAARLDAAGRFVGVGHARRSLAYAVGNSGSPWESYARALLIDANLSTLTQFPIGPYEADLLVTESGQGGGSGAWSGAGPGPGRGGGSGSGRGSGSGAGPTREGRSASGARAVVPCVVVEIDGDCKYVEETSEVLLRERRRETFIRNEGYPVLRYAPWELGRDPGKIVRQVREELRRQQR
ncbi:hypothetical protein [Corynebacterium aquatimens]|uniref:Membrane protein YgcG n=1 Tax=Corynebacterium aquatimens TaxID=1190508 RepID=A0A931DXY4_9CORY|nr:hypothetical protein [Corynebacterium aquatimens]MBG6122387.1 putative membrane protein YgcG [Corynebacterium aquatimens]